MNRLNLLQKLAPVGVAAFATTVGSMLVASSANAALFDIGGGACGPTSTACEGTFEDFVGSSTTIGDKVFTFNSVTNLPNPPENPFDSGPPVIPNSIDEIDLEILNNGDYIFTYDILPDFQGDSFTFAYDVAITSDRFFTAVDLDTATDGFSDTEENLETDYDFGPETITLVSFNGDSDDQSILNAEGKNYQSVTVFNDYDLLTPGSGEISSFENSFRQDEHGGSTIPEPTTILGLLTFGGLSLCLKRKKKLVEVG